MAKIGNLPKGKGVGGGEPKYKVDWRKAIEFAQAHPGTPVVPDELENVVGFRTLVSTVNMYRLRGPARHDLAAAMAELGGTLYAYARRTTKHPGDDRTLDRGDVWLEWRPAKDGE